MRFALLEFVNPLILQTPSKGTLFQAQACIKLRKSALRAQHHLKWP